MVKKKQDKKQSKQPKQRQQKIARKARGLTPLEKMIADPCNAPLESIYSSQMGGGHVFRVRSRFSLRSTVGDRSGFLAWYPSYHCGGADGTQDIDLSGVPTKSGGANLFSYSHSAFGSAPTNTVANPFGSSSSISGVAGRAIADPAFELVDSSSVSEARTLAACMTLKYIGTTSDRQGEVFVVNSLPQNGLMRRTGEIVTPSQLGSYAAHTARTPASRLDVIWRPTMESEYPRKTGAQAFGAVDAGLESDAVDAPFVLGVPAANVSTQGNSSAPGEVTGIALAYSGMNPGVAGDIIVELTKIVQIRYAPLEGIVEAGVPRHVKEQTSSEASGVLDWVLGPNWTVRSVVEGAASMTSEILGGAQSVKKVLDVYTATGGTLPRMLTY